VIKFGSSVSYSGTIGVVLELNTAFEPPLVFVEFNKKDFRGKRISGWFPAHMLESVETPKVEQRATGDFE